MKIVITFKEYEWLKYLLIKYIHTWHDKECQNMKYKPKQHRTGPHSILTQFWMDNTELADMNINALMTSEFSSGW